MRFWYLSHIYACTNLVGLEALSYKVTGMSLSVLPYFMEVSREASGKNIRMMHRLVRAYTGHLCNKYDVLVDIVTDLHIL